MDENKIETITDEAENTTGAKKRQKKTNLDALGDNAGVQPGGQTDNAAPEESPDDDNRDAVFTVKKDGAITETTRADVYSAFKDKYSQDAVDKMLDAKKVLSLPPDTYFSAERKKLVKFAAKDVTPTPAEKPSEAKDDANSDIPATDRKHDFGGAKPELTYETENPDAPFEQGDKVVHKTNERTGIVVFKDGVLKISIEDGKHTTKQFDKWRKMTDEELRAEKEKLALVPKKDNAIVGEVELPLSETEAKELSEREKAILEAKETHERAENVMAENLSVIRDKKLWRESLNGAGQKCRTFKEYVTDVLGFHEKYGQNLAQIGDFRAVAKELIGDSLDVSLNTNNAMVVGMNKVSEALGLGKAEFHEVRPIISAAFEVLGEVIKDDKGEIDFDLLKPQVVTKVAEKLVEVVKTETVEIDGIQMTVSEAKDKGIAKEAFTDAVLTEVAEGIKTKKQFVKDELNRRREENNKPPETPPVSNAEDVWTGAPSSFKGGCETHKARIVSIGVHTVQTACLCRYRMSTTGVLECIEVEGKRVK